jgi:hypothetical protein
MHTTFHYSFSTKTCGPAILFKVVLVSSKVALTTSTVPLEIPSCSWINIWSMRIFWPCTHPRILQFFVVSQVHTKFCNKSYFGVVHYRLNKLSKLARLAHLSLLESIFIHCSIFWLSFALNIGFFLIILSTYSSIGALPSHFIIVLAPDLGC